MISTLKHLASSTPISPCKKAPSMHRLLIAALLISGFSATPALSADKDIAPRDFGFRPLEIHKFKKGTTRLTITDLNNDGLDDVLFANNHISRLEILLRKPNIDAFDDLPELDDCFENKGIIVDQRLNVIRVDDLNDDGLKDILTFGTAIGLQIRYQEQDGSFAAPKRIFLKSLSTVTTIQINDLNGDQLKDILVCRRDKADLLWNSTERPFMEHKSLTFSGDKSFFGTIADLNKDDIPDLIFYYSTSNNPLKVRYGKSNGLFGIEQPINLPQRQHMDILKGDNEPPSIGMILRNRLAYRIYDFEETEQAQLLDTQETSLGRIGLEGTNKKSAAPWLAGDFNADELEDLLVAAPALSRLHLYQNTAKGLSPEPLRIDTLSEVSRISQMKNGDILVLSKKEKIAALHKAYNLTQFPTILKLPGHTLAGCAIESANESWFICKDEEKNLKLVKMNVNDQDLTTYPLDMQNDPDDLLAFHLPDNKTGLIFFMPYDTPKMKLFDGEKLTDLTSESFRALSQELTRSNIRLETPNDGSSLIVAQGAIARRFEWENDHYAVTRQFNPENPRGEMIASAHYNLQGNSNGTLFYDRNSGDLVRFAENGSEWGKIHIQAPDPTIDNLVQLKHPTRDIIILIDRTGLGVLQGNGTKLEVASSAEYISTSENVMLAYAKKIKLGSPPRPMIALVDPANCSIELVSKKNAQLKKELIVQIFLSSAFANSTQSRSTEPHDIESGDLNGDNIGDLVILAHDKLLIYLGE